jgi:hypothetical protein
MPRPTMARAVPGSIIFRAVGETLEHHYIRPWKITRMMMKIEGRKSESEADIRGRKLSASAEVSCSCRQATGDHG